jgi:uncharacterized protein YajQ (UPF0234 family)
MISLDRPSSAKGTSFGGSVDHPAPEGQISKFRSADTPHRGIPMAKKSSFDVSTGVDLQEVDNAVNQARKEIATRYDFKGTECTVEFDRAEGAIKLDADDEYRLTAVLQVVREKLSRRGVPVKNLDQGSVEIGSLGRARQSLDLKQGIDQETAKKMVKAVKDNGFKKVQVQIQADELRVTSPSKDELQQVMTFLKGEDWGMELKFGNYR